MAKMRLKASRLKEKIQSRSWQLIIPVGWENLEAIKECCRGIAQYYYFIEHYADKTELGDPVKPHWHLLMTFSSARRLDTMQNYFKEFGKFDEYAKKEDEEEKDEKEEKPEQEETGEKPGSETEEKTEDEQLLRPNSFERIYSITGAKKYLVHAEHPNKYQYSPSSVETNDKLFFDLFLPSKDKISSTKKMIGSFKQLAACSTFDEFLGLFEDLMYTMPMSQQISHVINLRRYYNDYRSSLDFFRDGFDRAPPKDDGFYPVEINPNYEQKAEDNLPF